MKESELRILLESATDFLQPKRMKEVIVVEERDDGTPGCSNAVRGHRSPTLLPRQDPNSLTFPHLALEILIVEVRRDDEFKRRTDGEPH